MEPICRFILVIEFEIEILTASNNAGYSLLMNCCTVLKKRQKGRGLSVRQAENLLSISILILSGGHVLSRTAVQWQCNFNFPKNSTSFLLLFFSSEFFLRLQHVLYLSLLFSTLFPYILYLQISLFVCRHIFSSNITPYNTFPYNITSCNIILSYFRFS